MVKITERDHGGYTTIGVLLILVFPAKVTKIGLECID